ncbi:MAG: FRG domain-containing protein [Nitrospira sp.]|nr:FRG domain-containing protein [Nitrospira sp.]
MKQIETVSQLLDHASERYFTEARGRWVFRGHSSSTFDLIASVGRSEHTSKDRQKYEQSLFDIFCREARGYLSVLPANDWEWLSLAQHHGLPTRLLDWTHNILVALYFVVEANPSVDGSLFALRSITQAAGRVREGSPFTIETPVKFYPNIVTPRIRAQEGLFVVCAKLEAPLDKALREDWELEALRIPAGSKQRLRYELFRMGVHASSLFPDVDGLAARLKWQHGVSPPQAARAGR